LIVNQPASAQDDFEQKYQAFQKAVNDDKASLDRKDYQAVIEGTPLEVVER
jgi:hypothetical protein